MISSKRIEAPMRKNKKQKKQKNTILVNSITYRNVSYKPFLPIVYFGEIKGTVYKMCVLGNRKLL